MEKEQDLYDLILRLLYKKKTVICFMVIGALLLGGYKAYSAIRFINRDGVQLETQRYERELFEYEAAYDLLSQQELTLRQEIEALDVMSETLEIMTLNPYEVYKYIIGVHVNYLEGNALITTQSISDAAQIMFDKTEDLISTYLLFGKDNNNTLPTDDGLLTITQTGPSTMLIAGIGSDAASAQERAEAKFSELAAAHDRFSESIGAHTLERTYEKGYVTQSSAILSWHTWLDEQRQSRSAELDEISSRLNALTGPAPPQSAAARLVRDAVKFFALGLVAGLVVACVWVLLFNQGDMRIHSVSEVRRAGGPAFLGLLRASPAKKMVLSDRLMCQKAGIDALPGRTDRQREADILLKIRLILHDCPAKTILLSGNGSEAICARMKAMDASEAFKFLSINDMDGLQGGGTDDGEMRSILIVEIHQTNANWLQFMIEDMKKMHAPVVGIIATI